MQKTGEKEYMVAFVSVDNEYLLQIQKFDLHDKLLSITELSDYVAVNSSNAKVYPQKISIVNLKTGEKSNMKVREVKLLSKVNINDFTLTQTSL